MELAWSKISITHFDNGDLSPIENFFFMKIQLLVVQFLNSPITTLSPVTISHSFAKHFLFTCITLIIPKVSYHFWYISGSLLNILILEKMLNNTFVEGCASNFSGTIPIHSDFFPYTRLIWNNFWLYFVYRLFECLRKNNCLQKNRENVHIFFISLFWAKKLLFWAIFGHFNLCNV